jgi:hypothetical protein
MAMKRPAVTDLNAVVDNTNKFYASEEKKKNKNKNKR